MEVKHLLIGIVILCALIVTPSSAYGISDSDYRMNPLQLSENSIIPFAAPVYGTITQGEEIQKIYVVPSGKTRLEINLLWENPNNDLRLYLTQPNGVSYPIFSDSIDGYIDAEILIHLNGNIYPGNWQVTIVGSRINVSEEYELYFNSI